MATPVDFPKYLQFLVESYKKQQHLYTLTDLQVEVRVEITPEDRSQPRSPQNKPETKIDRLEVLAGLRKYVQQGNVLLVGKPGSGKSTVLQRFRWKLAREALKDRDRQIPVLVQLRSDRSILEAICAEFRQAKLRVCQKEVDDLLLDGRLLLLLDGVNEMPSQQRRQDLQLFHDDNPDTAMIFTTRDLALGGSLGIEQQLEMCALTEPQMREFVNKHLPQHGDLLLGQLRDRLREIAHTLGKIGDEAAIPGLLKLIGHLDSDVRWSAADALGKIGDKAAIPGLLELLEHSDDDVRKMVADALGKIGDKAAIPGLLKLVEDSNSYVRWKATDALANIAKQHTERVVPHIPHLLTLIPSKSGEQVHRLILAIQAACKYYNYSIRQLSLTPENSKTNNSAGQTIIEKGGIINTGTVNIKGDQIGIQQNNHPKN